MYKKTNISEKDTRDFLEEKYDQKITHIDLITSGVWSQAYSFVKNNSKYVIRWSNYLEYYERDKFAIKFKQENLPIPAILEVSEKYNKYYAISQFVEGIFIEKLSLKELEDSYTSLVRLLNVLKTKDLSDYYGYGYWDRNGKGSHASWKDFLLDIRSDFEESIIHGWKAQLESSSLGINAFDQLYAEMEALVDKCPEEKSLIHSDLVNYNLLFSENNVSALIDWGSSKYGDSLYDIAWFIYYEPWFPIFQSFNLAHKLLDQYKKSYPSESEIPERLMVYQLHIGLGSIAYNSFKEDWKSVQEDVTYTNKIVKHWKKNKFSFTDSDINAT